MVTPSCPAFVIHDDDAFRKALIATLDQKHFTVTFATDGDGAVDVLRQRGFSVILLGLNLKNRRGMTTLEFLRQHREKYRCGIIVLGDPDPALRTFAPWVDETLLKPVDADYVATRARTYCNC